MQSSNDLPKRRLAVFSTKGSGSNDEQRICTLLEPLNPLLMPFDRSKKLSNLKILFQIVRKERPSLICMEGTGVVGGGLLFLVRLLLGIRYVVSSGDAVGPYVSSQYPLLGLVFLFYEKMLCRFSAGFIGWTPYLVGRALTYGAPKGMTAAGWAPFSFKTENEEREARKKIRERFSVEENICLIGIAGSLAWNKRVGYCYGWELIQAALRAPRAKIQILILGDGQGRPILEKLAGARLGRDIHLPGNVSQERVKDYLAAMDVVSLPQSVDGVGSFRYTTKLSEYLASGIPVITGEIPLAYDFAGDWLWRLPGKSPWDPKYIESLANLFQSLTADEVKRKKNVVPRSLDLFNMNQQRAHVCDFVTEILVE